MFDLLFNGGEIETLTPAAGIITVLSAVVLGAIICFTYMKTYTEGGYSQGFVTTLMMTAPIISIVVLLVGSNIARAFSLAGAFSIVRFRSEAGDPKDIAYIFFSLAAGLATGIGMIGYAFMFIIILCTVAFIMYFIKFGKPKEIQKNLRVTIPENLNYTDLFEDIFDKYTKKHTLKAVKTKDMGSVFELQYAISMIPECSEKEFIDSIRCRNGNLNIVLTSI